MWVFGSFGKKRECTGPRRTHPLLFSRLFAGIRITEMGGTPQFFTSLIFDVLSLVAPIALTKVLLNALYFTIGALEAAIVVFITSAVHGVRFVLSQPHLAVATLKGGALQQVHPAVHMWLYCMKELCAKSNVVMVECDGRALPQLVMRHDILVSRPRVLEVFGFEGEMHIVIVIGESGNE